MYSTQGPVNYGVLQPDQDRQAHSQPCASTMHCDLTPFQVVLSLASGSFCTHVSWSILKWLHAGNSLQIPRVLSLRSSFLSDADLWIPAATVSLEFQLCPLSSWSPPGSVCSPRPMLCPWNSLKTVNWSDCRARLFCFLSLKDHTVPYCLMFSVLETTIFHILSIFWLTWVGE